MKVPQNFIDAIVSAKIYEAKKLKATTFIYGWLEKRNLSNLEGGCNSDNLVDMIDCFINHDEDSLGEIIERIQEETNE